MKTLKKLLLATLLLCSSSSFANTGGGGFDDPVKLFKFYYKVAEEARIYYEKHKKYNPKHIKKLAPHVYSLNKNYLQSARGKLSNHITYVWDSKVGKHPFIVDMKQLKPRFTRGQKKKGIITIPYTYYKYQQKSVNGFRDRTRLFKAIAKKAGNKIKWHIYL